MRRILALACLLASLIAQVPAGVEDKEDVGTVIGIDLGTTYSWYANCFYSLYLVYTRTAFKYK